MKMRGINLILIVLGIIVVFVGSLPFLQDVLPSYLKLVPATGAGYSIVVLILGVIIVITAFRARRPRIRLR